MSRLTHNQQSHFVLRHNAILVTPPLLPKREIKYTTRGRLSAFTASHFSQRPLLTFCRAAGQQVRSGGGWSGGPPYIESVPLWTRWQTLGQVAGARTGGGRQSALAAVQKAGVVICGAFARVPGGAEVGGAVIVSPPAGSFTLLTLASEDADEGHLELTVVAGVDDGVQAAVEVAKPENDLEEGVRRTQLRIK